MAAGDVFKGSGSIAAGSFLDIRPSAGEKGMVSYVFANGPLKAQLWWTDGTNSLLLVDNQWQGENLVFRGEGFPVDNDAYLRVKNMEATAQLFGYSGIKT